MEEHEHNVDIPGGTGGQVNPAAASAPSGPGAAPAKAVEPAWEAAAPEGPILAADDGEEEDGLCVDDFDSRYIWDAYNKVLYEALPEEPAAHGRRGFGFWLALGCCCLLLALAIAGWLRGGKTLMPAGQSQSILEQAQANPAGGTAQADPATEPGQGAAESQAPGEAAASYVATAILVDGEVEGILASEQAAYALVEDVKAHFSDLALEGGEGELSVELMEEVSYRPAEEGEAVESYESLFEKFTASRGPIKVKCTRTTEAREEIGFATSEESDKYLLEGTRVVVSAGRPGAKVTITHTVYINGDKSSSRSASETQTIEPQNRVIRVGSQKVDPSAKPGAKEGRKGPDTDLVFQSPMADYTVTGNFGQAKGVLHLGLDYAPKEGASGEVLASCGGTVACVMDRGGYGLMVEIDHGEGFTTRYAHLSSVNVALGDTVLAGQVIGRAGQSGNAETVLLHFELRAGGEAYNPRYYLD